jgi:hypothetical protein
MLLVMMVLHVVIRQVVASTKVMTNLHDDDAHSRRLRKIETLATAEQCERNGVSTTTMNSCLLAFQTN